MYTDSIMPTYHYQQTGYHLGERKQRKIKKIENIPVRETRINSREAGNRTTQQMKTSILIDPELALIPKL